MMPPPASRIFGMVARVRFNSPESGREAVETVFVRRPDQGDLALDNEPHPEWTPSRHEALVLPWEQAQALAGRIGSMSHAVTVSSPAATPPASQNLRQAVPPAAAFERLEKRGLA